MRAEAVGLRDRLWGMEKEREHLRNALRHAKEEAANMGSIRDTASQEVRDIQAKLERERKGAETALQDNLVV